ncbi:MAG: response regulator [Peptococcaceae bacterium]|nr:response regulator [Peptococcaceae bacterium]
MSTITVLIVDDLPGTREDIKRLLYFEEDIKIVGEAGDGDEAVSLADSLKPDVILMDVNMPRMDGIRASEIITERNPNSAIVIVSIQGEKDYLRRAMAAGARDYLVKPFSSDELASTIRRASEFSKRFRIRLADSKTPPPAVPAREPGKIITFFSTKGGVGKTTVACNLAIGLAQEAKGKVALVDMDLQGGDVSVFMNIPAKGGLAEVAQEEDYSDPSLLETYFCPHMSGVRILPAPASPEQAELVTAIHAEEILKTLKNTYDYILVDTPAALNDVTLACLESSDRIVIIANQELPALRHIKVNLEILQKLNLHGRSRIVLNRFRPEILKIKDLESHINSTVWAVIIEDAATVTSSINKGRPFVLTRPSAEITVGFRKLASQLANDGSAETAELEKQPQKSIIGRIFSF